jgi:hypothetical protein
MMEDVVFGLKFKVQGSKFKSSKVQKGERVRR